MLWRAPQPIRPTLAAARLFAVGGHALETIGRARWRHAGPRQRAEWLRETCCRLCDLHGFAIELEGALLNRPAIYVANHSSYIDPVVLGSVIACVPIAKAEIGGWPLFGATAQALGTLFVQRGDAWSGARALRGSLRALASGLPVLGFPEGTTSRDEVLPFHRGLFGIARRAGVPIVPLALGYDDPRVAWVGAEWFLPHYLRTAMRPITRAWVRAGDPITPLSSPEETARLARARIAELLGRTL
jgi:1-acyl-sn-glycerol-3-phosphate acyltransferase